jgi:hypothetical protein
MGTGSSLCLQVYSQNILLLYNYLLYSTQIDSPMKKELFIKIFFFHIKLSTNVIWCFVLTVQHSIDLFHLPT